MFSERVLSDRLLSSGVLVYLTSFLSRSTRVDAIAVYQDLWTVFVDLTQCLVRRAFRDARIWSKKWYIAGSVPLVCLARNLLSVSEFQFANRSEF